MKKNLAVILRGQLRSWESAKFSIFKALEPFEKYFDITFFFVTWDRTYFTAPNLKSIHDFKKLSIVDISNLGFDFKDKNWNLHILNYDDVKKFISGIDLSEEYHFISYVRYISGLIKQNYEIENDVEFDLVIETRPDLFLLQHEEEFLSKHECFDEPMPDFVYSSGIEILPRSYKITDEKSNHSINTLFVEDTIFISNGKTSDVLTSEFPFLYNKRNDKIFRYLHPHNIIADHFLNFKLINIPNFLRFFKDQEIVRNLEYFDSHVNFFNPSVEVMEKVRKANQKFKDKKEQLA